ncbi:hypothetical protein ASPNIDRAFT_45472, partial [Aspergillus niger ATCC 1015]
LSLVHDPSVSSIGGTVDHVVPRIRGWIGSLAFPPSGANKPSFPRPQRSPTRQLLIPGDKITIPFTANSPAMLLRHSASRVLFLFSAFLLWTSFVVASSPASFCKCTCFSNSTIIPLDPDSSESTSALNGVSHFLRRSDDAAILGTRAKNYRSLNCNDCNRKFCLDYDLPTCHGAKEDDVFTTCFRMSQFTLESLAIVRAMLT